MSISKNFKYIKIFTVVILYLQIIVLFFSCKKYEDNKEAEQLIEQNKDAGEESILDLKEKINNANNLKKLEELHDKVEMELNSEDKAKLKPILKANQKRLEKIIIRHLRIEKDELIDKWSIASKRSEIIVENLKKRCINFIRKINKIKKRFRIKINIQKLNIINKELERLNEEINKVLKNNKNLEEGLHLVKNDKEEDLYEKKDLDNRKDIFDNDEELDKEDLYEKKRSNETIMDGFNKSIKSINNNLINEEEYDIKEASIIEKLEDAERDFKDAIKRAKKDINIKDYKEVEDDFYNSLDEYKKILNNEDFIDKIKSKKGKKYLKKLQKLEEKKYEIFDLINEKAIDFLDKNN